jgi:peptidoglycan/LPS O-acetylase OafA/YrhL
VIAVLLFHGNAAWLPAGFLGVEVFFVISGFIITRGLLLEKERYGRIDLRAFWLRRTRRLLPALFLLLAGVLTLSLVLEPDNLPSVRRDTLAAAAYVTNWDLIFRDVSYFDSWQRPSMLRHLWSLAIEEQFYVLWPALLTVLLSRLPRSAVLALVLAAATVSSLTMAYIYDASDLSTISRVYYGTDTRASGLLIGAALAFIAPSIRDTRLITAGLSFFGLASLGLLVGLTVFIREASDFLYRGGFFAVSLTTGLLILSLARPGSAPSRLLGAAPLRWLGVRSYGVYLWHWPVFLLVWPQEMTLSLFAALVAVSVAIAALSYRFLEEPVRRLGFGHLFRWDRGGWGQRIRGISPLGAGAPLLSLSLIVVVIVGGWPGSPQQLAAQEVRLVNPLPSVIGDTVPSSAATVEHTNRVEADRPEPSSIIDARPDRRDCDSIRGTEYMTPTERDFFLVNCVARAPAPETPIASPPTTTTAPAAPAARPQIPTGRITAVGDSVMLGAASRLATTIPGIDVDAAVGRQVSAAIALLRQRLASGQMGDVVVLHIGNNGPFTAGQFDEIMAVAGPGRRVILINVKLPRSWEAPNNAVINSGVARHANASVVDWHSVSTGRPGLFASDSVHLTGDGAVVYADAIARSIGR